jgi:hypothetical protein
MREQRQRKKKLKVQQSQYSSLPNISPPVDAIYIVGVGDNEQERGRGRGRERNWELSSKSIVVMMVVRFATKGNPC